MARDDTRLLRTGDHTQSFPFVHRYGTLVCSDNTRKPGDLRFVSRIINSLVHRLVRNVPLHPLDQFENAWFGDEVPELLEFVELLQNCGAESAISELCQIDMEHRWRSSSRTIQKWFARDYLNRPELKIPSTKAIELIGWEYYVRSRWGDYPAIHSILAEWARYRPELDAALLQTSDAISRPIIQLVQAFAPQRSFELDGVLEVGRQKPEDPPPFERIPTADGYRLIVAASPDSSISRTQLSIRQNSASDVRITNTSRNRAIAIVGNRIIDAGEVATCELPVRIHLTSSLFLCVELSTEKKVQ